MVKYGPMHINDLDLTLLNSKVVLTDFFFFYKYKVLNWQKKFLLLIKKVNNIYKSLSKQVLSQFKAKCSYPKPVRNKEIILGLYFQMFKFLSCY